VLLLLVFFFVALRALAVGSGGGGCEQAGVAVGGVDVPLRLAVAGIKRAEDIPYVLMSNNTYVVKEIQGVRVNAKE
jgi:hypothetical protein